MTYEGAKNKLKKARAIKIYELRQKVMSMGDIEEKDLNLRHILLEILELLED